MVAASAWRDKAKTTMDALIASELEFSADDLVNGMASGVPPAPRHAIAGAGEPPVPNMLGALFLATARRNQIRPVGFTQSTRPSAHARVQRTWRGVE
jgi:hypothetical protein